MSFFRNTNMRQEDMKVILNITQQALLNIIIIITEQQ